ncbi:copper resistance CopC/CopD family protein [Nocardia yamanashiensis]|uniref:copper resistance CopC/CopD family protein n=1 Tax=Nocardia yamanashiensis TaxID=209247 RepID=UPI00082A4C9C|nr:copper resistance protein CopC [Nocardia yamanashiensis]
MTVGIVLVCGWAGAGTAAAHAVLVGTVPAYGATVSVAPERVSMTFDEPVTVVPNAVSVADRDGERVDLGEVDTADGGRTVVVPLHAGVADGTYLLGWSLLSADGHVVAGSIVFGVGVPPDLSVTAPPPDPLVAVLDTVVRLLTAIGYAGVVLAVGLPLAARFVWRPALRTRGILQLIRVGGVSTAVSALLVFAATPGRLAGAAGWGETQAWIRSASSVAGASALLRCLAAVVLLVAGARWVRARRSPAPAAEVGLDRQVGGRWSAVRRMGGRWSVVRRMGGRSHAVRQVGGRSHAVRRAGGHWCAVRHAGGRWYGVAAGVAAALVVIASATSGHAVGGEYRTAALISTVLHVVAMAVWVGGVTLLVLTRRVPGLAERVARFGRVALAAVAVLVLTGLFQSWRAVEPLAALWDTSWGRLLVLKLSLVAVALGFALWGRTRTVRWELAAQVSVLVVSALLTGVAPAKDTYDPAVTLEARVGAFQARVSVDGAHSGRQEITVRLRDSAGTPVDALEVTGRLVLPDGQAGPIEVPFRRVEPVELGPDYFVSQPVRVPLAGEWQLRLTVVADRLNGYAATVPYRVW